MQNIALMILHFYHRAVSSARTRAKAARTQAYQEAIAEAAEELFAANGVGATKMEDIAEAAGLSVRTMYSALEGAGKADLVARIRAQRLEVLTEIGVRSAAREGAPLARLRGSFEEATAFFIEHANYLRMHLRDGFAWGLRDAVSGYSADSAQSFRDGVGAIASIVAEGAESGAFAVERPDRTTNALVMLHQVHLSDWIDRGGEDAPETVFAGFWRDAERLLGL